MKVLDVLREVFPFGTDAQHRRLMHDAGDEADPAPVREEPEEYESEWDGYPKPGSHGAD